MAKKLYSVALGYVQKFITDNKAEIKSIIDDSQKYEYSKILGRSHYEIHIQRFIEEFKIDKDMDYCLKILNHYKSYIFIHDIYKLLNLERFEQSQSDESATKDHQKNIFFCFVYYLNSMPDTQKEDIENRLFTHYFLHMLVGIKQGSKTELNFKELSFALTKGKDITIKESFKAGDEKATFNILVNQKKHIELTGTSVKTLRKKAYKQLFYDLIDKKI